MPHSPSHFPAPKKPTQRKKEEKKIPKWRKTFKKMRNAAEGVDGEREGEGERMPRLEAATNFRRRSSSSSASSSSFSPRFDPKGLIKGEGGRGAELWSWRPPSPPFARTNGLAANPLPTDPWHCSRKSQPGRQPPGSPPPPSVDPRQPPFPREEIGSQGRGKSHFSIPSPTSPSPFPRNH